MQNVCVAMFGHFFCNKNVDCMYIWNKFLIVRLWLVCGVVSSNESFPFCSKCKSESRQSIDVSRCAAIVVPNTYEFSTKNGSHNVIFWWCMESHTDTHHTHTHKHEYTHMIALFGSLAQTICEAVLGVCVWRREPVTVKFQC